MKNKIIFKIRLGIGDWGLGIGPNPQSPIPKLQLTIYKKLDLNIILIINK